MSAPNLHVLVLFIFIVNITAINVGILNKPKNLHFLAAIVKTGNEPLDGTACEIAVRIAIESVNQNPKLLPAHNLIPVFKDEGGGSLLVTSRVFEFLNNAERNDQNIAPIVIGSWYSSGCAPLARLAKHLNLVQLTFGCNSAALARNRKLFPNTYRSASTADLLAFPYLKFITEVGKWSRLAIITFASNSFDLSVALRIKREAELNNITVSHFDITNEINDYTILALLDSDPRIVDFQIAVPPLIVRFLCLTHKFGLTGPKYTFMFPYESFFEPKDITSGGIDGCTRTVLETQLEFSVWSGWQSEDTEHSQKRLLTGYNLPEFDRKFLELSGGQKPADFGQRLICHDTALNAILALDAAEKTLQARNMTLSDWKYYPKLVSSAANQSVAGANFDGLRLKNFRYDSSLEMDSVEVQTISRWTRKFGLEVHYRDRTLAGADPLKLENHFFQTVKPLEWFTKSRTPQNDRTLVRNVKQTSIPIPIFYVILSLGIISFLVSLSHWKIYKEKSNWSEHFDLSTLLCCEISNFLFIASSIIFLPESSIALCYFRPLLLTVAFASLQSYLFSTVSILCKVTYRQQNVGEFFESHLTVAHHHMNEAPRRSEKIAVAIDPLRKRSIAKRSIPWHFLLAAVFLISWFSSDHSEIQKIITAERGEYNELDDIYEEYYHVECSGTLSWPLSFAGINIAALLVQSVVLYKLSLRSWLRKCLALKQARFVAANAVLLLSAAILLCAVLQSVWAQRLTISIISFLLGTVSAFSFFLKNN